MPTKITLYRDPADNAPQVQGALDSLAAGGVVRLAGDAQPWTFQRPVVMDRPFTCLAGTPTDQTRLRGSSCFGPVVPGILNARKASPSHWTDPAGRLDATALSDQWGTPTPRAGLRTRAASGAHARPSFSDSPFSVGPHQGWSAVRRLTFDLAFVLHAAPPSLEVNLFGCQDATGFAAPYYLACNEFYTRLVLRLAGGQSVMLRLLWLPFATAGQLVRLSLQLDLDTGEHAAWIDGSRITTTTDGVSLMGVLHQPDEGLPFGLGAVTCETHAWGQTFGTGPVDLEFLGFKVSAATLYTAAATQARADGQPLNDRLRYFAPEATTLGLLTLLPATADRLLEWRGPPIHELGLGDVRGYGFLLDPAGDNGADATGRHLFQDLQFSAMSPYGAGMAAGTITGSVFNRCSFLGGAYALHLQNTHCTYPLKLTDCQFFGGWVSSLRAYNAVMVLDNVDFHSGYRHTLNLTGCSVRMLGGSMDGNERRVSSVKMTEGQYGAGLYLADCYLDFEGPYPSVSLFDVTASAAVPQTYLVLERVGLPHLPPGGVFFTLRPRSAVTSYPSPARLSLRDCGFVGNVTVPMQNGAALARQTGPGWSVETAGDPWSSRPQGVPLLVDAANNTLEP